MGGGLHFVVEIELKMAKMPAFTNLKYVQISQSTKHSSWPGNSFGRVKHLNIKIIILSSQKCDVYSLSRIKIPPLYSIYSNC